LFFCNRESGSSSISISIAKKRKKGESREISLLGPGLASLASPSQLKTISRYLKLQQQKNIKNIVHSSFRCLMSNKRRPEQCDISTLIRPRRKRRLQSSSDARAILCASLRDGLHFPFSRKSIVCLARYVHFLC
jgi:hypothetical protein